MDYRVLYRKYRPKSFNDLKGQDTIKNLLLNSIINNKLSHAYIFTGPRGTGKTSSAKIFAKTVNCHNLVDNSPCDECISCLSFDESSDVIEIDAASNNGVDEIREIRENVKILPSNSKYKIYIIDEVHMLSSSAWNAFLKTLEEPPSHVIFILATTEIQKVPITVLSRCQRFDFQRINVSTISQLIKEISIKEKIEITDEAIKEISKLSDGGLRDALGILDQLSKLEVEINLQTLKDLYGIVTTSEIDELFKSYYSNNIEKLISSIDHYKQSGIDSNILLTNMIDYLLNQLIENKINKKDDYSNLQNLIEDLEKLFYKSNQYLLIKATLLININIEKEEEISAVINSNNINKETESSEIISREIISEDKNIISNPDISKEIYHIRINNSFVNAGIKYKKEINNKWNNFLNYLFENNEFKIDFLLKNSIVEVVSPTNILFSTETYSNSILINSVAEEISNHIKNFYGQTLKIICLDKITWNKEKSIYIQNKDDKVYELIEEPETNIIEEVVNSAENIFGNGLVEIN